MQPGEPARAREPWEVVAASAILVGVLVAIDAGFLGEPALVLSLCPLLFLLIVAFVPLTVPVVVSWIGAFVLLAALTREVRYAGLAYTAVAFLFLLYVRGSRQEEP